MGYIDLGYSDAVFYRWVWILQAGLHVLPATVWVSSGYTVYTQSLVLNGCECQLHDGYQVHPT